MSPRAPYRAPHEQPRVMHEAGQNGARSLTVDAGPGSQTSSTESSGSHNEHFATAKIYYTGQYLAILRVVCQMACSSCGLGRTCGGTAPTLRPSYVLMRTQTTCFSAALVDRMRETPSASAGRVALLGLGGVGCLTKRRGLRRGADTRGSKSLLANHHLH